jgi:hypothetical protein
MNKEEKLQISNNVICWLSKETTKVKHIIRRLEDTLHIEGYMVDGCSADDLDLLNEKLKELECRTDFETRNINRIRYED